MKRFKKGTVEYESVLPASVTKSPKNHVERTSSSNLPVNRVILLTNNLRTNNKNHGVSGVDVKEIRMTSSNIGISATASRGELLVEWQAKQRKAGSKGKLDVVLMTHPRDAADFSLLFPWGERLTLDEREQLVKHMRPVFGEFFTAGDLNVAVLFLPMFAEEMVHPATRRRCRLILKQSGMDVVAAAGAKVACLGGLLGSLSRYGRLVDDDAQARGVTVTTGHSLTAISVLESYRRAVRSLDLEPERDHMSILGLGSVGWGFARLLMEKGPRPRHLTLVDTPSRKAHVTSCAEELRERYGQSVTVELTTATGQLQPETACYQSRYLISAVSSPYIVDINRVPPGAVLIDDSQPYCWSRTDAWDRFIKDQDILPCEAGLIDVGRLGYRAHFPFGFADENEEGGSQTAWCCLTEGLLKVLEPSLPATVGEPDMDSLNQYYDVFQRYGLQAAELQCGSRKLQVELLRANDFKHMASSVKKTTAD